MHSEEEDKKEKFDKEWGEKVQQTAQIARWQEDLQGLQRLYGADYRKPLSYNEQLDLIDDMGDFLEDAAKNGKRLGAFRAEVDKKVRQEGRKAQEYDEVQFYKEAEEALEIRRKGRGHEKIRKEMADYFTKKGVPKAIKESKEEEKFMDNLRRILEIYDGIDVLNTTIGIMKENVSKLEQLLVEHAGTPNEIKIRAAITEQQNIINEKIYEKGELSQTTLELRRENNEVLQSVRRELRAEARIIAKKFGGKINTRFRNRQALIEQLSRYSPESVEHFDKRQEIMQEIEEIESEIEELKIELIKYKSKNWLFHFERLLGVQSIPVLYRYGQASSLATERLRETSSESDADAA